jgi:hypothetical protein
MTDAEKLQIALDALEFYGRRKNWQEKPFQEDDWILTYHTQISASDLDENRYGGKRAREAYRLITGRK